jgi:hypothetical protein
VGAGVAKFPLASPLVKKTKVEEKNRKEEKSRQIEEIKMLNDIPNDPLASLENYTLDEVISFLQNHACDACSNVNQIGF